MANDVEENPGPTLFGVVDPAKTICAEFSQANARKFGQYAGKQCVAVCLLNYLADFITGRKQRVSLHGYFSPWTIATSGVPQGSVLGPVLFLAYINDTTLQPASGQACAYLWMTSGFTGLSIMKMMRDNFNSKNENWQLRFHPDK